MKPQPESILTLEARIFWLDQAIAGCRRKAALRRLQADRAAAFDALMNLRLRNA